MSELEERRLLVSRAQGDAALAKVRQSSGWFLWVAVDRKSDTKLCLDFPSSTTPPAELRYLQKIPHAQQIPVVSVERSCFSKGLWFRILGMEMLTRNYKSCGTEMLKGKCGSVIPAANSSRRMELFLFSFSNWIKNVVAETSLNLLNSESFSLFN